MDGVVFNNKAALQKVATRATKYVAKRTGAHKPEAEMINSILYKTYGHTLIGLQKVYGVPITTTDFNTYVYDDDVLHTVDAIDMDADASLVKNSVDIRYVCKTCKKNDIDVYVFSNAPQAWCAAILQKMQLDREIPLDNVIASDHDVFEGALKPTKSVYDNMWNYLSHKMRDGSIQVHLVDDSFINMTPILGNTRWKPVYFTGDGPKFANKRMASISSLYELNQMLQIQV
jgi:FMN phosphatase YigB (HAD superfamily)